MFLEGGSAPQLTPLTAAKRGILDTLHCYKSGFRDYIVRYAVRSGAYHNNYDNFKMLNSTLIFKLAPHRASLKY